MNFRLSPTRIAGVLSLSAVFTSAGLAQVISPQVSQQIAAIEAQKRQFTAAQKKLSSRLAFGAKAARNEFVPTGVTDLPPVPTNAQGLVTVDIKGTVSALLLNGIQIAGGQVLQQSVALGRVRATIPLRVADTIAGLRGVQSVSLPQLAHTNGMAVWSRGMAGAKRLVSSTGLSFVGAVTSQGYITHEANLANAAHYDGTGVKVGVLSDSATPARVAALIASGDLPPDTVVLPGESGSEITGVEDEGTAMMEIVHDLAPGAKLYFATAFHSDVDFANNIIALQQAGCRVIVDDVTYSEEGAFQDGVIAQAVNTVTAAGVVYFSAAANSGNLTNGTSGTWEGDFLDGGPVGGPVAGAGETGDVHNFGTVGSPQLSDVLTVASPFDDYVLQWSDQLGNSSNDYDFFLLDSTGTVLKGFSANTQNGAGTDPIEEFFNVGSVAGDQLVVVLFSGSPRALHIDTERGRLAIATSGATFGHNAGLNTVTTAATAWNSAHAGTKAFTGFANPIETFSSDGPRKIFYNPDGSAITPGNLLFGTNGGTTLAKPNITAADGVYTKTPGFLPFFGTSAAAPHAASIAAMILEARPDYTVAQVKAAMAATALDTMAVGPDRDSGVGITVALPAVQYAITH
jgi:Subtilase family